MKKLFFVVAFSAFILASLYACTKKDIEPEENISFEIPKNFPSPIYDISKNPVTKAGFELGKALFYDGILSRDGTISCGNCHQQPSAFTQHGHDLSHGIDDQLTLRNSLPIMNLAWRPFFFWDGGVVDLDLFAIAPIEAHNEMDNTVPKILEKLKKTEKYPLMFERAFGNSEITPQKFLKALSQFQLMCISSNSKYDKIERKEANISFSEDELAGKLLFEQKCSACHQGTFFTNNQFTSNGLPINNVEDTGRERITWLPQDKYKFKVPSLRNVAFTHPYMHDGRFRTLEAVLDFYDSGVQDSPQLDPILKQNNTIGIKMTTNEKRQIITFLNTLSDNEFINNKMLSAE